jgi:hypothetical protein
MLSYSLRGKPDLEKTISRFEAWFRQEVVDRAPIRFISNNQIFRDSKEDDIVGPRGHWKTYRDRWFDIEWRVESYIESMSGINFPGDNLPVFFTDFGPNFYAALYGAEFKFDHTTAWVTKPVINSYENIDQLSPDMKCEIMLAAENLYTYALERSDNAFLVGLPDLFCGIDTLDTLRGTENLLIDMLTEPDHVKDLQNIITKNLLPVYDRFADKSLSCGKPTCNWMGIPVVGRFYIVSADLSTMFSSECFDTFALPWLQKIAAQMDRVVFHVDGKGVIKNIDSILSMDGVDAVQWVQGMSDDRCIIKWIPQIKYILSRGKSVIVDVDLCDLESFISAFDSPNGIFLMVESDDSVEQERIINRVSKW